MIVLVIFSVQWARTGTTSEDNPGCKFGIFDSRAVAMAYYRSEAFSKYIAEQHSELKKAKEELNESRIKELSEMGPAIQAKAHQQGFGNAPVDDIIKRIEKELPEIAKEAGVDLIISKWEIDYLAPGARCIDITHLMVKPFAPSPETLKVIKDIQKKDPVPLDVLKEHKH